MGFLNIYNRVDKVELGGGYYIGIKTFLSKAETARAERVRISPKVTSQVSDDDSGKVKSYTSYVDQDAYNTEILAAVIVEWNLDDETNTPIPLPPYIPPAPGQEDLEDLANQQRRETIQRVLPAFAVKRILAKIKENEDDGADAASLAAFPGESVSAPSQA